MSDVIDVASMALGAIGHPVRRKEDQRLLTGKGRFSDDVNMAGQVYAVMVRSPHPHARIVEIDMEHARRMPGLLAVFSGGDCLAEGLAPIPHSPVPQTRYDMKLTAPGGGTIFIGPQLPLPADRVRHVGEAIAVEYEELPWVISPQSSLAEGASAVWDEVPDNVLVDTHFGDEVATDRAFTEADHVVVMEFHIGRVTGVPIEPRAALGHYDAETGRYTLWAGSGGTVRQKAELAAALGVAPERVRVVSQDVGGNF